MERERGMNVDGDGDEEIVGMGMAMGWIGGMGVCTAVYTRWYGRTTTSAGWSHAVAAVASIHHSLRLFATVPTRSLTRKLVCGMTSFRFGTTK